MKFSQMPYERPNVDELIEKVKKLLDDFQNAKSAKEQLDIYNEIDRLKSHFHTLSSIAHTRSDIDTRDEYYAGEVKYLNSASIALGDVLHKFNQMLLDSPYRKGLEESIGKLVFDNMEMHQKGSSSAIMSLSQEESELEQEYMTLYASAKVEFDGKVLNIAQLEPYKQSPDRKIRKAAYEAEGSFFDGNREKLDEIFDKLVKNRTKQAKMLGFDNFVELGYIRRGRNCYGPKEVASFRNQVLESVVPITMDVKKQQQERIGVDSLKFYDNTFIYPDGNPTPKGTPDELLACAKKMYSEMSPETKEFIELMMDNELFDVVAKAGKAPGAYCTGMADYKYPFVLANFNGTASDVNALTHEAGHAFAIYTVEREIPVGALRSPGGDGGEVHSMAMEYLTSPWHKLFFKEDTHKYQLFHACDSLTFIPYGVIVDYFQELVYSHPEMTPEERNKTWLELEHKFRPYIDFEDLPFYSRGAGWQRQLHIYTLPFYYIDYCIAQTLALQFFAIYLKDSKAAWEKYLKFVRMGGTKTLVGLIEASQLKNPFEQGSLKEICSVVTDWLEKNK